MSEAGNWADMEQNAFLTVRVRLLARAALRLPFILLVISSIVGLALNKHVPTPTLVFWIALCQLTVLPRAAYSYWILYKRVGASSPSTDYRLFIAFGALSGAGVGMSAPLFFPFLQPPEQAFIGMVLTGLVAGGVATSGSSPFVLGAYAIAALVPLGISWTIYGNDEKHLVTWLVLLFSLVMVAYARDGKKMLFESFMIRRERDEAYALLEQKNREVMSANTAAEASGQAKARILAAASHDLRQPLHALSIYSAVLAADPTANTLREVAQNVDQLVRSLGALLDALLDLSQLDSNNFPIHVRATCLAAIAARVSQEFEHAAAAKQLPIDCRLSPAPVISDPLVLERIVRNLLDNAIKYTDTGHIALRSEVAGNESILTITDTGKGVPEDQLTRIFEEFYQLDNPGRDRSQGLGLGLSIVQRMVELLGARIKLSSVVGAGTSVTLSMPFSLSSAKADPILAKLADGQLAGKTVLLIDDESAIVASMSALLQVWKVRALCATTPEEAFLHCTNAGGVIDLIIADLRLGKGESGVAIVRKIRAQYGSLPALIISGETAAERIMEATDEGLFVLQKPISPERLYLALTEQFLLHPDQDAAWRQNPAVD